MSEYASLIEEFHGNINPLLNDFGRRFLVFDTNSRQLHPLDRFVGFVKIVHPICEKIDHMKLVEHGLSDVHHLEKSVLRKVRSALCIFQRSEDGINRTTSEEEPGHHNIYLGGVNDIPLMPISDIKEINDDQFKNQFIDHAEQLMSTARSDLYSAIDTLIPD